MESVVPLRQPLAVAATPVDGHPICLPGYGLAFDHFGQRQGRPAFDHPIATGLDRELITIRELRMLQFINQITDKPDWDTKVFDQSIISKWKDEASRMIPLADNARDVYLSESMFEYCIKELQDKAKAYTETKVIAVLDNSSRVVKSDVAVSHDLRENLSQAIKPLENLPEKYKDWHPGSNGLVLDLVHPSLFPLIYGTSWVLPHDLLSLDCMNWTGPSDTVPAAKLEKAPGFTESDYTALWARREPRSWGNYMWLPSNISFDNAGKAHIDSYINNLHPEYHKDLYRVLEKIVDATIPLWNEVFSGATRNRIVVKSSSDEDYLHPRGVAYDGLVHPDSDLGPFESDTDEENFKKEREEKKKQKELEKAPKSQNAENSDEVEEEEEEEEEEEFQEDQSDLEDAYKRWKIAQGLLSWPDPEEYVSTPDLPAPKRVDLAQQENGLQIIFKLANIHLTPEKPKYPGGSWHIEGALNEYIVASAIYYYDEDNITDSHLAFRHILDDEDLIMIPPQEEYQSIAAFYGVEQDGSNLQELGQVLTRQGRLLCFPNVLQHCVQSFELKDATKPGHRKILAMFLVNPSATKLSTANIPPQRKDWWSEEVRKISPFSNLPLELFDNIMDFVEYPLSWEQACEVREKLMAERTAINDANNTSYSSTISFCEH